MSILIVTDKLFPDEVGGSCTYAYETALNLKKLGNNIDIFTSYPEKKFNDSFFKGINLYRDLNKRRLFESASKMKDLINRNNYKCIIFHSPISWFIYYLIKNKINYKMKEVGIFHGPWNREAKLKYISKKQYFKFAIIPLMKFIEYKYASNVKNFVFLSHYMRNELIKINSKAENINYKIIHGGVNLIKHQRKYSKIEARKKLNLPQDGFIVFSLRRLEYRMGLHVAINSMDNVDINNVIYIIGGKGPFEVELKKRAHNLKKSKCIFAGFIPENELNLYFCASDLFLVPSIDLEGFGLVILESLAMGLPVITTPQGGMVELKGKLKNFYLANGCKSEDLSFAINEFYYGEFLKGIEREDLSKYDWKNISSKLMSFIAEKNY